MSITTPVKKSFQTLLVETIQKEYPNLTIEEINVLQEYDCFEGQYDESEDSVYISYLQNTALHNGMSAEDLPDLYVQAWVKIETGIKDLTLDCSTFPRITGYGETFWILPSIKGIFPVNSHLIEEDEDDTMTLETWLEETVGYLQSVLGTDELTMDYNELNDSIEVHFN